MMTEEQVKTLVETKVKWLVEEKKREQENEKYTDAGWPRALVKAINDPFDYYIKLKNGDDFYFREAIAINEHWVLLQVFDAIDGVPDTIYKMHQSLNEILGTKSQHEVFPRGLEVRVSEIAYIADAPHGS